VDRREPFHRLDLDDELIFNDQIGPEGILDDSPLEDDRNWLLPFDPQARIGQANYQCSLVGGFEQAWTEFLVNSKAAINRLRSELFDLGQLEPHLIVTEPPRLSTLRAFVPSCENNFASSRLRVHKHPPGEERQR